MLPGRMIAGCPTHSIGWNEWDSRSVNFHGQGSTSTNSCRCSVVDGQRRERISSSDLRAVQHPEFEERNNLKPRILRLRSGQAPPWVTAIPGIKSPFRDDTHCAAPKGAPEYPRDTRHPRLPSWATDCSVLRTESSALPKARRAASRSAQRADPSAKTRPRDDKSKRRRAKRARELQVPPAVAGSG